MAVLLPSYIAFGEGFVGQPEVVPGRFNRSAPAKTLLRRLGESGIALLLGMDSPWLLGFTDSRLDECRVSGTKLVN